MDIPEEGISDRTRERMYGGRYESNVIACYEHHSTPPIFHNIKMDKHYKRHWTVIPLSQAECQFVVQIFSWLPYLVMTGHCSQTGIWIVFLSEFKVQFIQWRTHLIQKFQINVTFHLLTMV